jgi:hypothetical protein
LKILRRTAKHTWTGSKTPYAVAAGRQCQRLNSMRKIVLCIEEFQHVVHNVSEKDQETVADTLKNLMETSVSR